MTISPELRHAFNFHRTAILTHWQPTRHGLRSVSTTTARAALDRARADLEAGKRRYMSSPWVKPVTNQRFPAEGRNAREMQWIEKPASMGLRFVGYCDEICSHIGHTGWYTDAYGNESIRGVVYQLPGRNGRARFVAGHDNADNGRADNGGPALIDWSQIHESDFESEMRSALRTMGKQYHTPERLKPGYWAESAHETARKEAARAADEFTRVQAEQECEYQTAWQAGSLYASETETIETAKGELKELFAERRQYPAFCAAIRAQISSLLDDIHQARKTQEMLKSGDYEPLYFYPNKRLQEAFNEGAGQPVF